MLDTEGREFTGLWIPATLRKLIKKGYVERHPKRALGRIIGMAYTAFSSLEGRTKNGAAD